jgi:2-dehydro-3-deoxyphosphogluconate aldolase/(4S)-4-hydroxy-2-oxoglutarate aldolase
MSVINKILAKKVTAIIRSKQIFDPISFVEVIIEAGIDSIEITMTTPNALSIITDLKNQFEDSIVLGAGTVLDIETAKKALDAGAEFIVTPVSNFQIIDYMNKRTTPIISGAFSPTEIYNCHMAGSDIVKVFPANILGINYFKSIRDLFPDILMMPTGGITIENSRKWIEVGANALGVGSNLLNDEIIEKKNYGKLKSSVQKLLTSLK